jgi:hypothetical protein
VVVSVVGGPASTDPALALLPDTSVGRALVVGSPPEGLADRCRELLVMGVGQAVSDCRWPPGRLDLVVLHDIGPALGEAELHRLVDRVARSLARWGMVVVRHGRATDEEVRVDVAAVAATIQKRGGWERLAQRLDGGRHAVLLGPSGRLPGSS